MSETNIPFSFGRRNAYCTICDKFFSRPYALRRHNLTKHLATSRQVGHGLSETGRDSETSSSESSKNSDEDGSSTHDSEDTEAIHTDGNSSDSDDGGPELNAHDKIVSKTFIKQYKVEDTKRQKLKFVRGVFDFDHHFRKSNLYKIVNNAMDHFQTGFESMGRKEALKKAVSTRSEFVLKFFKEDEQSDEDEEEDEDADDKEASEEEDTHLN